VKRIVLVAGARPNFMKIAPLWSEMKGESYGFEPVILHTGQHYDYEMSRVFFEDLGLPEPHYFLGIGSGTHAEQTGRVMIEFEKILRRDHWDWVVVVGDVNSTLACSITAKKLNLPVAHVEAGLRSYDMTMPEEINRKVTDAVSDVLFTPSRDGNENLLREGIRCDAIYFVGNIMIDSLMGFLGKVDSKRENDVLHRLGLESGQYALVTLHRPSNVDDPLELSRILNLLSDVSLRIPVLFAIHPRTRKNMSQLAADGFYCEGLKMVEPLRYTEFVLLEKNARFVLTDSGGIQEETTYLGVPCLTLRTSTERPITIRIGTNELVTTSDAGDRIDQVLSGNWKKGQIPELWDGQTARRVVEVLGGGRI
jgi:UDP-N-acetylglucosamine 2-epimerase (non-hydrolysing)